MAEDVVPMLAWLDEHKGALVPPVCNKLMHGGQLKVMFVGGPNVRKDYHIEEGEEAFFMVKGDMCLNVVEKGVPRPVHIREGEVFVLPSRVPHSPQRKDATIGLVIERERLRKEMDCLRYYCDGGSMEVLWERWFHCVDLGSQLKPVIEAYFASEEHKTRKPTTGAIDNPPFAVDTETELMAPIDVGQALSSAAWVAGESFPLIQGKETTISASRGSSFPACAGESWLLQWAGQAGICTKGGGVEATLAKNDTLLLPRNAAFDVTANTEDSVTLVFRQVPA